MSTHIDKLQPLYQVLRPGELLTEEALSARLGLQSTAISDLRKAGLLRANVVKEKVLFCSDNVIEDVGAFSDPLFNKKNGKAAK
jgi:hypothetical protein